MDAPHDAPARHQHSQVMNRVATADRAIRAQAFEEAAARMGMPAAIIEKDFWVCWLLGLLFDATQGADHFVFKGGLHCQKCFM